MHVVGRMHLSYFKPKAAQFDAVSAARATNGGRRVIATFVRDSSSCSSSRPFNAAIRQWLVASNQALAHFYYTQYMYTIHRYFLTRVSYIRL